MVILIIINAGEKEILQLVYETNPTDRTCHQRVRLSARPLVIVYHVPTLKRIVNMFQSDQVSDLSQLQAVARKKMRDLKKTSFVGLEYAIQRQPVVDVNINIRGSYLIVPDGGVCSPGGAKILCNTGNLLVQSRSSRKLDEMPNVNRMVRAGNSEDDILSQMLSHSYD